MTIRQLLYLILCIFGTILPYGSFLRFLQQHGLDISLFIEQMFATPIAAFFSWDVIVSSLVVWVLVFTEGPRRGMSNLWVYVLANLAVGVSLALPLFLFMRERKIAA
ncbi:MAG: DUF2834 domain-containing protein [Ardenticatenaceae bacterium]|nr:DUF2834 domain-containing protein [Ardenticatenaceae bacterium]